MLCQGRLCYVKVGYATLQPAPPSRRAGHNSSPNKHILFPSVVMAILSAFLCCDVNHTWSYSGRLMADTYFNAAGTAVISQRCSSIIRIYLHADASFC